MCVHTNQKTLRVAKTDITLYKVIDLRPLSAEGKEYGWCGNIYDCDLLNNPQSHIYKSLYFYKTIKTECVENEVPYVAQGEGVRIEPDVYTKMFKKRYRYGAGFIHGYKNKEDVLLFIKNQLPMFSGYTHYIAYRCVIPKGTEYVCGVDDEGDATYAARQIVYKEPIWFGKTAKKWFDKITETKKQ